MISITNDDGSQQALVYSGVDLTKETLPNGEQYTYTYKKDNTGASTHQIETISDQNGVEATYGYDAFGWCDGYE